MAIEQSINKALKQFGFKSRRSGNGSGSEKGSSAKSDWKCHKCGKKGHIKKDCKSKVNGSSGNTPKKSINELPEWVTMNPVVSDTKYMTTATMTRSISGYGPFYQTCDKLYLTWQTTLFQSHYHFHCGGSWNQPDSKPGWLTVQWPLCMLSEVKVVIETFLCL